jgi:hypothetical protein
MTRLDDWFRRVQFSSEELPVNQNVSAGRYDTEMAGDSTNLRKWSDTELTRAVAASSSWRGLMRALGLPETSPKMILHIKQDITRLDLDTSHFTVRNIWSEGRLKRAIANAHSWSDLLLPSDFSQARTTGGCESRRTPYALDWM